MAKRGEFPGLIRRRRAGWEKRYWSADTLTTKAKDFPDRLIPLPSDATDAELKDLCETYAARLNVWLAYGERDRVCYDGTIGSLCDVFEQHAESPIHEVKYNTADSYIDSLKVIRSTVAKRAVRALSPIDVKAWYKNWRLPAKKGLPERIKRAHDAVAALRMILRFGRALGYRECGDLVDGLEVIRFERSKARTSEMTYEQVKAFIAACFTHEAACLQKHEGRGLYMAIGTAVQFETVLRQKDIIGEWIPQGDGTTAWHGHFTWENIPGGIFRLPRTSKTGKAIEHDLTRLDLLWPLMQQVPQIERVGPIIKGEHDLPIREKTYRKWFRQIARKAGIPDTVWNMDTRAGAVTEAFEGGAEETAVQRAATHSSATMTRRYDRRSKAAVAQVVDARKKIRSKQ